jgi:hypothetical protein
VEKPPYFPLKKVGEEVALMSTATTFVKGYTRGISGEYTVLTIAYWDINICCIIQ